MQSFRASMLIPLGFLADDAVNDLNWHADHGASWECDEPVSGVWSGVRADPHSYRSCNPAIDEIFATTYERNHAVAKMASFFGVSKGVLEASRQAGCAI